MGVMNYAVVTFTSNVGTEDEPDIESITTSGWVDIETLPGSLLIWGTATPGDRDTALVIDRKYITNISRLPAEMSQQLVEE